MLAAELGADAIGLLVGQRHNSPDFISATVARDVPSALPPSVEPVLVTQVEDIDELERLLQQSEITDHSASQRNFSQLCGRVAGPDSQSEYIQIRFLLFLPTVSFILKPSSSWWTVSFSTASTSATDELEAPERHTIGQSAGKLSCAIPKFRLSLLAA